MTSDPTKRPTWWIIDANNIAHIYLHASGGDHRRAATMFGRLVDLLAMTRRPERLILAFDPPGKTFRHELDPTYKANRRDPPLGLASLLETMAKSMIDDGHEVIEVPGFESDDIIATIASIGVQSGRRVVMHSRDKDLRQCLVGGLVNQCLKHGIGQTPTVEWYNAAKLKSQYGLRPDQWAEYQAIVGDTVDNVKGCYMVGEGTAAPLLARCETLARFAERPYAYGIKDRTRQRLLAWMRRDMAATLEMVTLRIDVPVPDAWMECVG